MWGREERVVVRSSLVWHREGVGRHRRAKAEPLPSVKPQLESLKPVGAIGSCSQILAKQSYGCMSKGHWLIRKFHAEPVSFLVPGKQPEPVWRRIVGRPRYPEAGLPCRP